MATCEANGLNYVLDPTNFEPAITERNSIRHDLKMIDAGGSEANRVSWYPGVIVLFLTLSQSLPAIEKLLHTAQIYCELGAKDLRSLTVPYLRRAVSLLSDWVAENDEKGLYR